MKKPIVLIVDDEPGARAAILSLLEVRFDCTLKEAGNGEEAVDFVKSNTCDVMFLDIKLPKKNGLIVLKEVKAVDPKIDVIMVTGYSSDEVAEEALKYGATDYATKPLDLEVLLLKFSNILERRGQKFKKT